MDWDPRYCTGCNSLNPSPPFNLMALKYLHVIDPRHLGKKILIHSHSFFLSFFFSSVHISLSPTFLSAVLSSVLSNSQNFQKILMLLTCFYRYHFHAKPPSSPPWRHSPATISLPQRSINPCYASVGSTA